MRTVEHFKIESIAVAPGRRNVSDAAVSRLAESLSSIGLRTPITVRIVDGWTAPDGVVVDGQPVLVTGAHRLAAAKSLGWQEIECFVFDGDNEIDAQIWEIAENLHRAELTKAERADQVAEWIRLVEEKQEQERQALIRSEARKIERESDYRIDEDEALEVADEVSRQLDAKPEGGRPEGGTRAASRELGISEPQARRAKLIASMTPAAKKAAKAAGLDNNQKALERIARKPEAEQVAEVTKIKKEREDREKKKEAEREKDEEQRRKDKAENDFNDLIAAWKKASPWVRGRFRAHIKE